MGHRGSLTCGFYGSVTIYLISETNTNILQKDRHFHRPQGRTTLGKDDPLTEYIPEDTHRAGTLPMEDQPARLNASSGSSSRGQLGGPFWSPESCVLRLG